MLFYVVLDTCILCSLSLSQAFLRDPGPCSSDPCENGSTCISQQNIYTCACAHGWTGTHCEKKQTNDAVHIFRRSVSTSSPYFCDSGWTLDRTSCYFIGQEYINAYEAFTKCEDLNSYIVEINDEEENDVLSQQASNLGRSLWIGLTDSNDEDIWRWRKSGIVAEFTSWGSGEPNNKNGEDCALYSTKHGYKWNDLACTEIAGYICEVKASDVDECNSGGHNCSVNADCENTEGGFTCSCKIGFSGDGANCTDIDECESDPCLNGATCQDSVNSYTCDCKDQFTGSLCETDMCQPGFPAEADVIFLVDTSFSQSSVHLEKQKNFVKDFVSKFSIGRDSFHISLVTSSLEADVLFYLNNLTTAADINETVDEIVNEKGPTYTGKGLQKIRESVLQSYNGARVGVNTFVFVLTDGLSSQLRDTKYQADKLKSLSVEVISVAVGKQMYHKELIDIASHRTRVFPVSSDDATHVVYKAHVMEECPKCFHRTTDVAIMVDASSELSVVKYYKQIDALVLLFKNMPVDVDDVHVSCAQYAQDVEDEFHFTDYMTSSEIVVKMNRLKQLRSSSANVTRALEHLRKFSFSNSSGARDETRKIALLVINADSKEEDVEEITDEADRLKDSGVILVIIAIGISESLTTLLNMASDPSFTFFLGDDTNVSYDALFALLGSLDFDTCNID